jgi:hypothetical protein
MVIGFEREREDALEQLQTPATGVSNGNRFGDDDDDDVDDDEESGADITPSSGLNENDDYQVCFSLLIIPNYAGSNVGNQYFSRQSMQK